jgi:hypothetical protein
LIIEFARAGIIKDGDREFGVSLDDEIGDEENIEFC